MGKSNGRVNMWLVDSLASNSNAEIPVDNILTYGAPYALTEDTQLVYKAWVENLLTGKVRLNYAAGIALPIVLSSFQTLYSKFGSSPKFKCRKITGGGLLTASANIATTSAANGTYTAQAVINNTSFYNTALGAGATVTIVVLAGVVTSVTIVANGSVYYTGDTFTVAAIPGAVFQVVTNNPIAYQDLTASSTINITEVTDEIPDGVSINVDDDGTGHLADNLQLIISN